MRRMAGPGVSGLRGPLRLALLLVAAALCALPTGGQAASRGEVDSLSLARGRSALWRSALVSGWGQAYNGDRINAALFFGGELALLLAARDQHGAWRDWRSERLAAEDATELAFAQRQEAFYLTDRNKLLWWWLWLKLGTSLDAYVSGALSNFDTRWDGELAIEPLPGGGARCRLRLPLKISGPRR
jgi:hypothetical protein